MAPRPAGSCQRPRSAAKALCGPWTTGREVAAQVPWAALLPLAPSTCGRACGSVGLLRYRRIPRCWSRQSDPACSCMHLCRSRHVLAAPAPAQSGLPLDSIHSGRSAGDGHRISQCSQLVARAKRSEKTGPERHASFTLWAPVRPAYACASATQHSWWHRLERATNLCFFCFSSPASAAAAGKLAQQPRAMADAHPSIGLGPGIPGCVRDAGLDLTLGPLAACHGPEARPRTASTNRRGRMLCRSSWSCPHAGVDEAARRSYWAGMGKGRKRQKTKEPLFASPDTSLLSSRLVTLKPACLT